MQGLQKASVLDALKQSIERLEKRPKLMSLNDGTARAAKPFLLAGGLMQEVFAEASRDGGAALGFALGLSRPLVGRERLVVLHCSLAHEGQERGIPYGPGLSAFGFDPEGLVMARLDTVAHLLWVVEEALGATGVAAVIADLGGEPKVLDFTASRRLAMRAAQCGASVLLLRYGAERQASAAQLRWGIAPAASGMLAYDARAPGASRLAVTLEKGRVPWGGTEWLVEADEHGLTIVNAGPARPVRAPAHGALPAALGDRLSEAG